MYNICLVERHLPSLFLLLSVELWNEALSLLSLSQAVAALKSLLSEPFLVIIRYVFVRDLSAEDKAIVFAVGFLIMAAILG